MITPDGDRDGLPTVLLEAKGKAVPVVTTTVTGGPEIMADSETGLLCPPDDPQAPAEALSTLLADPVRGHAMGQAGRLRTVRLFDLSTNAARLAEHFARVIPDLQARGAA